MATMLTRNFSLEELIKSDTATRYGIKNTPNEEQIENLKYLCEKCLQPARDFFGVPIKVNSGFRSAKLNERIGGSPRSFHSIGCAADIEFVRAGLDLIDLFNYFYNSGVYTELIAEELPGGWIHVAIERGRESEHQLKYKMVGGKVTRASYNEIISILNR